MYVCMYVYIYMCVCVWKQNMDKLFEVVEDCPICCCGVHLATGALAKVRRSLTVWVNVGVGVGV